MKQISEVKETGRTFLKNLVLKKILKNSRLIFIDYNIRAYNSIKGVVVSPRFPLHNLKIIKISKKIYSISFGKENIKIDLEDPDIVKSIIKNSNNRIANFALLGDKHFFFNKSKTEFIMYESYNKALVTLGEIMGLNNNYSLLSKFIEFSKQSKRKLLFYDVSTRYTEYLKSNGFKSFKIGEEALVPLENLLRGKRWATMRSTLNRLDRKGFSFKIIKLPDDKLLKELRIISDTWLKTKNVKEKRFSMGYFNNEYLKSSPIIIIEKEDKIYAFANLLSSSDALSVDLIRYIPNIENGLMDYLFLKLMGWAKFNGFEYFNLGMAPLSGLKNISKGDIWGKTMRVIYTYGGHFYNFKGIRKYKNKFSPTWEPKYLVMPRKMPIPLALIAIASLISGGIRHIILPNLKINRYQYSRSQ